MYSEDDLRAAVAGGAIAAADAAAIRAHVAGLRDTPQADEETFRLVSGFNDIFVAIAGALALFGISTLVGQTQPLIAAVAVAVAAWALAEFFTLRRRMALPSILFLMAFHFAVIVAGIQIAGINENSLQGLFPGSARFETGPDIFGPDPALLSALQLRLIGICLATAVASGLFWLRFKVPLAVATASGSIGAALFVALTMIWPEFGQWLLWPLLGLGLILFGFAMAWDLRDPGRTTGHADVAFWLHLQASPMIVHSIFALIALSVGLREENALLLALVAIAIYAGFAVIALIVDRRAILVSALAYFIVAMIYLLNTLGKIELNFAISAVIIGATLLLLSAYWQRLRALVLDLLPAAVAARLPATSRITPGSAAHV